MPIHVLQCDSSCRVLPVKALEDPVLEKRVHGHRHNGDKRVDGCFLRRQGCNQYSQHQWKAEMHQGNSFTRIITDRCGSQPKALMLAATGSRVLERRFSGKSLL